MTPDLSKTCACGTTPVPHADPGAEAACCCTDRCRCEDCVCYECGCADGCECDRRTCA